MKGQKRKGEKKSKYSLILQLFNNAEHILNNY